MISKLMGAALAGLVVASAATAQERPLRLDESAVGEMDPAKGTDYADTVLAVNLYESLVYPRPGGGGVIPWLATSWEIDGLTYRFTLRDGAVFASGNPVTAADVVYSFNRLMALGQGNSSLFAGRVASVEAVDDKTVAFALTEPFAPFLAAASRLWVVDSAVAKEHQAEGGNGEFGDYASDWLSANSAGSGAYVATAHDPQIETVMVPNPNYGGQPADAMAPDQVTYRYSLEASTVRALMARGEHDISSVWLPPEVLKAMADEGSVHLEQEPGATGEYIKLNTARPPLDDVHCRRALMFAYDYATTLKLLTVTPDVAQGFPMKGVLPQGLTGADIDAPDYAQDMDKAKEELAQCQYDPGEYPLDIAWIAEVPARERLALLMQATFTQLGFRVNVIRTPWALITEQVTKPETAPHAIEIAINAMTPDPDSLLFNMYSSTLPPTWMSSSYLKSAEVDNLLVAGRMQTDPDKRAPIYRDLNRLLRDLSPDIVAYETNGVYAVRNGVEVPNLAQPERRYPISAYSMLFKDIQVND
ncbi:ABC transporter substrate-binding protein [Paracoccus sp. (in: a-proteobacteria)]|uniref:ABC transporter substrate-binding protein n=1 Tax=Paracoccus sp. TaxID=267 RepID=UPI003A8B14FA